MEYKKSNEILLIEYLRRELEGSDEYINVLERENDKQLIYIKKIEEELQVLKEKYKIEFD